LPDPDEARGPETELAVALEARPEVQRLSDQVGQYDLELRVLRNQLLPALDFTTTVSQDLGRSPSAKYDSLGKTELEFSLLLEVPLLYNAPLGRITAASAARAKLVAQLGFARERVEVELRDARSALDAARERVRLTRREIELATLLERGEQTRFELGESTLLIVNLREQASAEARLREVDALVEFHKALASLKAAASR
jgi:outer membrane protein TolC